MSRRFSVLLACVVLAAAVAVPASAYATKTIGLSSGRFRFENVNPGQTVKGTVVVGNDGDEPIKVLVYAADQTVNETGNVEYKAPDRADLSAMTKPATWTKITMPADSKSLGNLPYLEMKPGEQIPIKFAITVPNGIPPGDHNMLIFFEVFDTAQGTAQISGRLGTRVVIRVNGTVLNSLELRPFNVEPWIIGDKIAYDFLVRNLGNVDERVTATTMLLDTRGNELSKQTPIDKQVVYAQTNLMAAGTIVPPRPIGKYVVRTSVQPVDDNGAPIVEKAPLVEERTTWIAPLWALIALGVGVLVAIVALIWWIASRAGARGQARRDQEAVAAAAVAEPLAPPNDDSYYDPDAGQ